MTQLGLNQLECRWYAVRRQKSGMRSSKHLVHRYVIYLQASPALPAGQDAPLNDTVQKGDALQLGSLAVLTQQGFVKGYSKIQVKVLFTPAAQGPVKQNVEINFRCDSINMQFFDSSAHHHCHDTTYGCDYDASVLPWLLETFISSMHLIMRSAHQVHMCALLACCTMYTGRPSQLCDHRNSCFNIAEGPWLCERLQSWVFDDAVNSLLSQVASQCDTSCRAVRDKKAALPSIRVGLAGLGKPVPVYTDSTLVDFKVSSCIISLCRCSSM